ncbi:MAG: hypothetical protein ACLUNX_03745 [Angelakisella sp.]
MRYKLTLRWLGTHYCGWQVQPNAPTICGAVQDAVERLFGERGELTGCSRTDSGVHAVGFVAALKCEGCRIPPEALRALNVNLPKEIAVTGCCAVEEDFHPRYDAVASATLPLVPKRCPGSVPGGAGGTAAPAGGYRSHE